LGLDENAINKQDSAVAGATVSDTAADATFPSTANAGLMNSAALV